MVTASDRSVVNFSLSGGEKHDSPEGTALHEKTNRSEETVYLIMDRAYEGDAVRETAVRLGYIPVDHRKRIAKTHGSTTKSCTSSVMKWNVSFCA